MKEDKMVGTRNTKEEKGIRNFARETSGKEVK